MQEGEESFRMYDSERDNREPSVRPVTGSADLVSGTSGGVLALLLTLAMSVAAVSYGIMMFLYAIRYGHVEPFWFIADLIVPFLISVLLCVGCWIVYICGRKKNGKTAGFTCIGTAMTIEIIHWLFAWAMSCVANVEPYVDYVSGSDNVLSFVSGNDLALLFDVVFIVAAIFLIAALGVQMEVSIHRSVIVPAKTLLHGGDVAWKPSRLSLGMPVLFAVLLFVTEDLALIILANFSDVVPELSANGLAAFPFRAMTVYLVSYIIVNIFAVVIIARIRGKSRSREGRSE